MLELTVLYCTTSRPPTATAALIIRNWPDPSPPMTTSDESLPESRPLLADGVLDDSDDGTASIHHVEAKDKRLALIACFLIILANAWLATLMGTPVLRLFEASACRDYYLEHDPSRIDAGGDVPEKLCKVTPVQEEVAFLNTSISVLTSTIGLSLHLIVLLVAVCESFEVQEDSNTYLLRPTDSHIQLSSSRYPLALLQISTGGGWSLA